MVILNQVLLTQFCQFMFCYSEKIYIYIYIWVVLIFGNKTLFVLMQLNLSLKGYKRRRVVLVRSIFFTRSFGTHCCSMH